MNLTKFTLNVNLILKNHMFERILEIFPSQDYNQNIKTCLDFGRSIFHTETGYDSAIGQRNELSTGNSLFGTAIATIKINKQPYILLQKEA
jgi:hypothetical protein